MKEHFWAALLLLDDQGLQLTLRVGSYTSLVCVRKLVVEEDPKLVVLEISLVSEGGYSVHSALVSLLISIIWAGIRGEYINGKRVL